ncbi:hypothetical protein Ddc_11725 [Ditylenchus destructor]|nr:hypothetical protein Ddc_11725 [Ditylenchus destructor]
MHVSQNEGMQSRVRYGAKDAVPQCNSIVQETQAQGTVHAELTEKAVQTKGPVPHEILVKLIFVNSYDRQLNLMNIKVEYDENVQKNEFVRKIASGHPSVGKCEVKSLRYYDPTFNCDIEMAEGECIMPKRNYVLVLVDKQLTGMQSRVRYGAKDAVPQCNSIVQETQAQGTDHVELTEKAVQTKQRVYKLTLTQNLAQGDCIVLNRKYLLELLDKKLTCMQSRVRYGAKDAVSQSNSIVQETQAQGTDHVELAEKAVQTKVSYHYNHINKRIHLHRAEKNYTWLKDLGLLKGHSVEPVGWFLSLTGPYLVTFPLHLSTHKTKRKLKNLKIKIVMYFSGLPLGSTLSIFQYSKILLGSPFMILDISGAKSELVTLNIYNFPRAEIIPAIN